MPKSQKLNRLNFSYFFTTSFLSLLAVFVFLIVPLLSYEPSPVKKTPQQLPQEPQEKEPEVYQIVGTSFPENFFQELKFGETKNGEITENDQVNPLTSSGMMDGYKITLPDLPDYNKVEVYFRSCPDDGDSDHYNNCLANGAFAEKIYVLNSNFEIISKQDSRLDFEHPPVIPTKGLTLYLLVGTDGSGNKTGHYKITFDYEEKQVTFKVKVKGIDKKAGELKAKVKLVQVKPFVSTRDIGEVMLVADDQGYYWGNFFISDSRLYDFTDYTLLIKGPKHVQRRFPNLTFTKGKHLDLTSKPLEPGDLPLPQNGKVDQNDFNYLWNNRGSTEQNVLKIGDLNLDGAINMGDINLLLETLSVKSDEEGW